MAIHKVTEKKRYIRKGFKFTVDIEPMLHASVKISAISAGIPLYKWVASALEEKLQGEASK